MTREEATEEIKRIKQGMQCDFGWNKSGIEALDMAIEALQTEFSEDCISRQQALDTFGLSENTRKYGGDHSGYDTIMLYEVQDALEALPSVQPTVCIAKISFDDQQMKEMIDKAISNFDFSDLISRQAVIDAVCRFGCGNERNGKLMITMAEAKQSIVDLLEDLPSVQPEQKMGHWIDTGSGQECSLCREIQYGYDNFRRFCASCGAKMESEENMKYKTIDNPCYHCYTGAIGECAMIECEHLLNSWSQDLESETIEILNTQAEGSDKE